ncbi:MAG: cellulase family glycosylhydrolase [Clostridia bacterium]|nr:cellulase family glycosylhydrolase [Clostridia bacterium]
MKKLVCLMLIMCFSLSALGALSACKHDDASEEIPQPAGYITASGKDFYTAKEDGEKIFFKGVNAGGWLVTEDWMCPTSLEGDLHHESGMFELWDSLESTLGIHNVEEAYNLYRDTWWTTEDFDHCKSMGFNSVRLPFTWRDLENKDGSQKSEGFQRLDWFIDECARRQMYVILDLHGAHGSQNGKHHSGDTRTGGNLYDNEENMSRTEALWVRVAEHYKENKWIAAYDLLNEPEGTPGGAMHAYTPHWDYYDRLYKAIRAVDPNRLIMMEAVWELYNLPNPEDYGWENIAYQLHFYLWSNSGNLDAQKEFLQGKVAISDLLKYNVPIYIGEFTFFHNPDSWLYGLALFREQGWSWAVWTYKVYGENSSWGLYNGPSRNADNVVTKYDSIETIRLKWENLRTSASFVPNEWLIEIMKEA